LPYGEGAYGGNRHKKILVQGAAGEKIFGRVFQNRMTCKKPGGQKGKKRQKAGSGQILYETGQGDKMDNDESRNPEDKGGGKSENLFPAQGITAYLYVSHG